MSNFQDFKSKFRVIFLHVSLIRFRITWDKATIMIYWVVHPRYQVRKQRWRIKEVEKLFQHSYVYTEPDWHFCRGFFKLVCATKPIGTLSSLAACSLFGVYILRFYLINIHFRLYCQQICYTQCEVWIYDDFIGTQEVIMSYGSCHIKVSIYSIGMHTCKYLCYAYHICT